MQPNAEKPVYQLTNHDFRLTAQGGLLLSMQPGPGLAGKTETQFILPGASFGQLRLAWKQAGDTASAALETAEQWTETPPEYRSREVCYAATAEAGPLGVSVSYRLAEGCMVQEFRVRNRSGEPLELLDAGFPFPCNTHFAWGVSASDKVIGHHFIAGHGSHLLFVRCDGAGPYLLALPENGTSLEYFTLSGRNRQDRTYTAYALSAEASRSAREKHTRMPAPGSSKTLAAGEEISFAFRYVWTSDVEDTRKKMVEYGLVDSEFLPGLTVPSGTAVSLALTSRWDDLKLVFPYPGETECKEEEPQGGRHIYRLRFRHAGENIVRVEYANGRWTTLTFFVTLPVPQMIEKRGAFIAAHQHNDPSKWYNGLLAEWNNETGVLLGPDNYDLIKGWRIYEVTCDDPGLGKPAFLSGKLAEYPDHDQIAALDRYVEHFVWGGLQCTEEEEFPYALYGIPDWKQNRDSADPGLRGKLHIWRIYDYPHIFLMYYNLYRIARDYPDAPLSHPKELYLKRAYKTAVAMFTVPMELDRWDAIKTGLYNELTIEDILRDLRREGMESEASRLERHWDRKVKYFATECTDIFGSEYPFDTTGFESTHAFALRAMEKAENVVREDRFNPPMLRTQARDYLENQMACNIACRGVLEPAYYWYGSDYRSTNAGYTLSYMSQMGGWAILDYALRYADDPYALLRLGYGSVLSSWALLNAGEEKDNYGYWFPGKQNDGAASGGFEPVAEGETWLGQEHRGGAWVYSCEIDLGFCGALRGAATVLADDPIFGRSCYGGELHTEPGACRIDSADGVSRRFHIVNPLGRLHFTMEKCHFAAESSVKIAGNTVEITIDPCGAAGDIPASLCTEGFGPCTASVGGSALASGSALSLTLPECKGPFVLKLEFAQPLLP